VIRLKGLIGQRGYMWFQKGKVCGRKVNGRSRARIVLHFVGFCHWNFIFAKKQFNNHVLLKVSAVGWATLSQKTPPYSNWCPSFNRRHPPLFLYFTLTAPVIIDIFHVRTFTFSKLFTPRTSLRVGGVFFKINILKNYLIYKYKK
jgi:hypothetical protein